jgi:DNA-binding LacI/PurR family transcriptional regulator
MRSRRAKTKAATAIRATTIKDLAKHLGIAHSTVSRALNDNRLINADTKKRVLEAAAKLGYIANQSARSMRRTHSGTIGLLLPSIDSEPFFVAAKMLAGLSRRAGYQLLLAISDDDPRVEFELVQRFREARVAGIIVAACPDMLDSTVDLLRNIPAVQWMLRTAKLAIPSVGIDERAAIFAVTSHLLQLGHRSIAFVSGPETLGTAQRRRQGFRDAMVGTFDRVDESMIISGPLSPEFARASMVSLLQRKKRPTAVVAGNSALTLGIAEALNQARIAVPRRMSFVGYGDPAWFRVWGPGITTVTGSLEEMTEAAATLLMQQIDRLPGTAAEEPVHLRFRHTFTLRGSVGPPFSSD